jgi:cytochrome c peroxidase
MTRAVIGLRWVLLICLTLSSLPTRAFQSKSDRAINIPQKPAGIRVPIGIGESLWRKRIPRNNPSSTGKVALGRVLYFDKRLSVNGTVSCATCHDPANAFTDHNAVALGAFGRAGTRNAPTILNAMFSERLFWDGRAGSLEEQAKQPLTNEFEMGMGSYDAVVARLVAIPQYRMAFRLAFKNDGITIDTIAKAIATYERTLLSGNSPFDRFITGNNDAITEAQKRGWLLFKGKARCIECHTYTPASPFFTNFKFHNTGIAISNENVERLMNQVAEVQGSNNKALSLLTHTEGVSELGRYLLTQQPKDVGAFKTPTLRDIELTGPYMHNGSQKTLLDVVKFYSQGGERNSHLDERMRPLNLTDQEINDVVEFLRALTSDDVLRETQSTRPQTRSSAPQ